MPLRKITLGVSECLDEFSPLITTMNLSFQNGIKIQGKNEEAFSGVTQLRSLLNAADVGKGLKIPAFCTSLALLVSFAVAKIREGWH
jgi:hypothetical protein